MTSVSTLREVCEWLERNVSPKIRLKRPDNSIQDENYGYIEVNPSVYPLYMPTQDKNTTASAVPCICVWPKTISTVGYTTTLELELAHICWNVGLHSNEIWTPTGDGVHYTRPKDGLPSEEFSLYEETWYDMMNFADITRNAIIANNGMACLELRQTEPITQRIETQDIADNYGVWVTVLSAVFDTYPSVRKQRLK